MIRSVSNITDISVIDQNNDNNLLSLFKIEFDDDKLGSGGFGTVYKVQTIDGKSNSDFVIKIFNQEENKQHAYEVIELLHQKIKKHQLKTKTPIYHDLPELLGLPFMVFKGYDNISDEHCVAFLMYNLNKFNFKDYDIDKNDKNILSNTDIPEKLYLGYQLTKVIDFLHNIEFIHADISENSLWLNLQRTQLSLIDYDSGYHYDKQDKPSTLGKIGQWISGQRRNIIGQKKDASKLTTLERIYEEYWVLANALFEVIFGVMPFFFLTDADDTTKSKYLKTNEWPNIDENSPFFNKQNQQQQQAIIEILKQFNENGFSELIDAFKLVFNKGYKSESARLTTAEWKNLLFSLNEQLDNAPLIKEFKSDKVVIKKKGEKVKVSFKAEKYNAIYINNKLVPFANNNYAISLEDSSEILLELVNDFNSVTERIAISAIKNDPNILSFEASKLMRDSLDPIILKWDVENAEKVFISFPKKEFLLKGNTEVMPEVKTTYTLNAIGYFDQEVSKELTIEVISPIINKFTWEVNLNEGIENIDLNWDTENTEKVEITPYGQSQQVKGIEHIPIREKTTFKLKAVGLFSFVEKEITAHPFPVPIVEQIFAEAPKIEINANLNFTDIQWPNALFTIDKINFSNSINFNNTSLITSELEETLKLPTFENENLLYKKVNKNEISISVIYKKIKEKIYQKLG